MFSVLRFLGPDATLLDVGQLVELHRPGMFTGLDRASQRFSCTLSECEQWIEQQAEITASIVAIRAAIDSANRLGVRLELDIAIKSDDFHFRWLSELRLDRALLALLSECKIELVFSFYGNGPA